MVYSFEEGETKWTFTYDENGNRLTYLTEYMGMDGWYEGERQICTYDQNGNKLTHTYESKDYDEWVCTKRYTRTYDQDGNVLTYHVEDFVDGTWVNTSMEIIQSHHKRN